MLQDQTCQDQRQLQEQACQVPTQRKLQEQACQVPTQRKSQEQACQVPTQRQLQQQACQVPQRTPSRSPQRRGMGLLARGSGRLWRGTAEGVLRGASRAEGDSSYALCSM